MRPWVGASVWWFSGPDAQPLPAVVTGVYTESCVRLTVFGADGGTFLADSTEKLAEDSTGKVWAWPRVYIEGVGEVDTAPSEEIDGDAEVERFSDYVDLDSGVADALNNAVALAAGGEDEVTP